MHKEIIDESGISQYVEIDSFTLEGKRRNFISGRWFGSQFTGKVSFVNAGVEYDLSDWAFQVEEAIDGIEIGGRNLILQSDIRNWEGVTFGEDENGTYARTNISYLDGDVFPSVEYKENIQYTFSGGYKKDSGNGNGLSLLYSDGSRAEMFRAYSDVFETFSYTSEKGKTITSVERIWSTGGDTRYYNLKIKKEKGTKQPTGHLAPEDVQA